MIRCSFDGSVSSVHDASFYPQGDADTAEAQRWIAVAMSMKERKIMITRRFDVERLSVVSSKPFQSGPRGAQGDGRLSRYGGVCQGGYKCTDPSWIWKMSFEEGSGKLD